MATLWKQTTPLHPTFVPLNGCLAQDWFLLPFELRLQQAHAKTLAAAGIYSAQELAAVNAALAEIDAAWRGQPCPASDAEDLHTWIEAELTQRCGGEAGASPNQDAGKKIHTARSRNDQVATLLKLYVIDAGQRWAAGLAAVVRTACQQATAWADLPLPVQTHQQFAAPGSAGFWMLRYAAAFERVRQRVLFALSQWQRECPLGSGAVAGSSVAIDRQIQATGLGFAAPSLCALDSTTTRDECLELVSLGVPAALHLQSLAIDVINFAQTPLAYVKYPAAFGTGSSMMPNKRNPDAMELLRGEACSVLGAHAELVALLKGLPSGYNRDLQCAKPVVHRVAEKVVTLLDMTAAFLGALAFDADRCAAALRLGHVNATLRMEQLVRSGKPLREAHHAVAEEVYAATDGAVPEMDAPLERYRTAGSAHPDEVRRAAAALLTRL